MNDPSPTFHPSAEAALRAVLDAFPDTSFLALGQTALWDEPTKAVLRRALDTFAPDARMVAAAHDTDYFAKLPGQPGGTGSASYALVSHDDARMRGLWSAAGEMSRLFGSEDVPTRAEIERRGGVSLQKAVEAVSTDSDTVLSELTTAWGWTGIIHTGTGRPVVRDVPLADILPTLLEQIGLATRGSAECLEGDRARAAALSVGVTIRGWVEGFARSHPDASLADLYRDLFPRFYELLLGAPPANLATSSTTRLLRFNRQTAGLPRFAFVDLFLNPITRRAAIDAYNLAVAGSDTYTLDRFSEGALPFDLVVPGKGRGTLCVLPDGTVLIETTPQAITLCDRGCNLSNVQRLAELVERELGPDVTLVGKAVTLLPMLAAEFAFVFHEGASGYSERTHRMVAAMRRGSAGALLPPLRPLLRIRYSAWDALSETPNCGVEPQPGSITFKLPEFLAQAFGRPRIAADELAACWRHAISTEEHRLEELSRLRSPRHLLAYLSRREPSRWSECVHDHEAARRRLLSIWSRAQAIQGRIYTEYDQIRRVRVEAVAMEREKGDDFRARVQPICDQARIAATAGNSVLAATLEARIASLQEERAVRFDAEIRSRLGQIRYALARVRELRAERLVLERSVEATGARVTMRRIEAEAEIAKARLVRNALQTIHGLPHTAYRPSAWWFPLVDPTGGWFQRLSGSAEFYLEPLGDGPQPVVQPKIGS
jgi:hypothetical protein